MGIFSAPITEENEIIKSNDFNEGSDCGINNVVSGLKAILSGKSENFVIGGEVKPYDGGSGTSGLNVVVSPAFVYCTETGECIVTDETSSAISIGTSSPKSMARIDILEVRAKKETYNPEVRMFNNPSLDAKEQMSIDTKERIVLDFKVVTGSEGSSIAPDVEEGYVKLAEIHLAQGQEDITENDIYNITSRKAGEENTFWSNDKKATYNPTYLADLFGTFLVEHTEDGSHGSEVIKASNILLGTGTDSLTLSKILLGSTVGVKRESISPSSNGTSALDVLGNYITDLYLYVDGVISRFALDSSLTIKAVSTEPITSLSGLGKVDGETLSEGDIVLLVNQSDKSKNGLWEATDGAWKRATGYKSGTSLSNHLFYSRNGDNKGRMFYVLDADDEIDEDTIEFGEAFLSPFALKGTAVFRDENGRFKAELPKESDDVAVLQNIQDIKNDNEDLEKKLLSIQEDLEEKIDSLADNTNGTDENLQEQITELSKTINNVNAYVENVEKDYIAQDKDLQEQINNVHVKVLLSKPTSVTAGDIWLC